MAIAVVTRLSTAAWPVSWRFSAASAASRSVRSRAKPIASPESPRRISLSSTQRREPLMMTWRRSIACPAAAADCASARLAGAQRRERTGKKPLAAGAKEIECGRAAAERGAELVKTCGEPGPLAAQRGETQGLAIDDESGHGRNRQNEPDE